MSIRADAVDGTTADYVEMFRTALMADHSDDYDAQTVADAAWSCARAVVDEVIERSADIVQLHAALETLLSTRNGPPEVREAAEQLASVMLDTIHPPAMP